MSQQENPTPTADEQDPTEQEATAGVVLVRTGWVRLTVNGQMYRLRPPFFGELKARRLALDAMQESLEEATAAIEDIADQLITQDEAARQDDPREYQRTRRELVRQSRQAARDLDRTREGLLIEWWRDTFRLLCVEKPDTLEWIEGEDMWPPWVGSAGFPNTVVNHWRAAPLAHG